MIHLHLFISDRHCVVGIATRYWVDVSGFETRTFQPVVSHYTDYSIPATYRIYIIIIY
jgi:hypothetical protein